MADQTIEAVLFVLGLVYVGLLIISIVRTWKQVCKKREDRSEPDKIFARFYVFVWVLLLLTVILYMFSSQPISDFLKTSVNTSIVCLYFAPTILMVLAYVLLYQQLDLLMTQSRIPSSEGYRNRFQSASLGKCVRLTVTLIVGLFIIVQFFLIVLCLFAQISIYTFYIEIYSSLIVIILSVNVNQLIVYCKLTGSPYKNKRSYRNVRQLSIVCAVWTLSFVVKLLSVAFGRTLFYIENQKIGSTNYGTACLLAFCDFLSIVIPMYCVVEDSFVKLMTGRFLKYANGYVPNEEDEEQSRQTLTTNFELRQSDSSKAQLSIPLLNKSDQYEQNSFAAINPFQVNKSESQPIVSLASLDQKSTNFELVIRTAPIIPRKLDSIRQQLEQQLSVKENDFKLTTEQYLDISGKLIDSKRKMNQKLGELLSCTLKSEELICRKLDFERLTQYQIESYFTQLARIYMLRLNKYVLFPKGIFIDSKTSLHIIHKNYQSLSQLLHDKRTKLSSYTKLQVLIQVAKIVNTFHRLEGYFSAHGSLTPQNIFVSISRKEEVEVIKVKIDGFELVDLKKYANMFHNYRNSSVYSPPEVLRQPKKVLEPLNSIDAYSFGMVMWELYHEILPFDGNLNAAVQCVVVENLRPKIFEVQPDEDSESRQQNVHQADLCSAPIADLIRRCWDSDPDQRPDFNAILGVLWHETTFFSKCETEFNISVDSFEVIVEE